MTNILFSTFISTL